MMFPRSFNRVFEVWAYSVSHAKLLLRSTKSDEHATRIDLGFKNVRYIQLPTLLSDLSVHIDSVEDLNPSVRASCDTKGVSIFVLQADQAVGYVVAGYGGWIEDDREYDAPSELFPDIRW
jgi:hypothetical protein